MERFQKDPDRREQHEEEKLFKSVIDKLTLAGKSGEGLYFIDKELATLDAQN